MQHKRLAGLGSGVSLCSVSLCCVSLWSGLVSGLVSGNEAATYASLATGYPRDPRWPGPVPGIPLDFPASYVDIKIWYNFSRRCPTLESVSPYCAEVEKKARAGYVTNAKKLGEVNELVWKCNYVLRYLTTRLSMCHVAYDSYLVVPMVTCEKEGVQGYDLGLNVGEYGMEIASQGVWADWTQSERDQIISSGSLIYTAPLSSRVASRDALYEFKDFPFHEKRPIQALEAGQEADPGADQEAGEAGQGAPGAVGVSSAGGVVKISERPGGGLEHGGERLGGDVVEISGPVGGVGRFPSCIEEGLEEERVEVPSHEARCAAIMKNVKGYGIERAENKQPVGRGFDEELTGIRASGWPISGTAFVDRRRVKLRAETKFVVHLGTALKARAKSIKMLPAEKFFLPWKKFQVQGGSAVGCTAHESACDAVPVQWQAANTPDKVLEYLRVADECVKLSVHMRLSPCYVKYDLLLVIPATQCGAGSIGFDFGFNPAEYMLKIDSSTVYINVPGNKEDALDGAAVRTVPIARRIANKHDFEWWQPSPQERCAILKDFGSRGGVAAAAPNVSPIDYDGKKLFPFTVNDHVLNPTRFWLNGTAQFYNLKVDFPLNDTYIALRLTREVNPGRPADADVRIYRPKQK